MQTLTNKSEYREVVRYLVTQHYPCRQIGRGKNLGNQQIHEIKRAFPSLRFAWNWAEQNNMGPYLSREKLRAHQKLVRAGSKKTIRGYSVSQATFLTRDGAMGFLKTSPIKIW